MLNGICAGRIAGINRASITDVGGRLTELLPRLAPQGSTVVAILDSLASHGAPEPYVIGREINDFARTIVTLRLLAQGVSIFRVHRADSLLEDLEANRFVDLVVADPPYNQRDWRAERVLGDPRWRFAVPTDRDANTAWIQHSDHHLLADGKGIVVIPPGALFTGGRAAELRRSLVAGVVVVVVEGASHFLQASQPEPALPLPSCCCAPPLLQMPDDCSSTPSSPGMPSTREGADDHWVGYDGGPPVDPSSE